QGVGEFAAGAGGEYGIEIVCLQGEQDVDDPVRRQHEFSDEAVEVFDEAVLVVEKGDDFVSVELGGAVNSGHVGLGAAGELGETLEQGAQGLVDFRFVERDGLK